jgi:hypothetical protein
MTGPLTEEEKGNRSFVIVAGFDGLSAARKTLYGKKSGDPSTKQSRLSARARAIEKEVTQEDLNRLTITSGGEEILLSKLFSNIGKTRTTAETEKAERDKAKKTEKGRKSKLSKLIRTPVSKLSKAAVASYLDRNRQASKMTLNEFVRNKYQRSDDPKAVIDWVEIKDDFGLTRAAIQEELRQIKDDFVEVSNLAEELGLSSE